MLVQIKPLRQEAQLPTYATDGAAAFDFYVPLDSNFVVGPGSSQMVGTGLAFAVPPGHAMFLFSRSGHGAKYGVRLSNCVGVIDSDYRGEVMGAIRNDGLAPFALNAGDRFMQGLVLALPTVSFELLKPGQELSPTARGAGGFGSTDAAPQPGRSKTTHTPPAIEVSTETYNELYNRLEVGGFKEAIASRGCIDMDGILVRRG